jgi:hypothetical protein
LQHFKLDRQPMTMPKNSPLICHSGSQWRDAASDRPFRE